MNDAKSSASFMSALAAFSNSLSESGIAVYGVAYDLLHFGSWTIEAGKRHHRSLLQWDGKESVLSLSQCEVADSQAPRDWSLIAEEPVSDYSSHEELFDAAENLLVKKSPS
jgi:hypothetical protein